MNGNGLGATYGYQMDDEQVISGGAAALEHPGQCRSPPLAPWSRMATPLHLLPPLQYAQNQLPASRVDLNKLKVRGGRQGLGQVGAPSV